MSKISLTPNATGSANFTIASPATSTDRTLTLPDNTGTILTSASNTNFPAGSVLQVVQASFTNNFSTTTNGFVNTQVTASITPKSATSKILIQISPCVAILGASTDAGTGFGIVRNSTQIYTTSFIAFYAASGAGTDAGIVPFIQFLDSPSTTSSTAYTLQVTRYTNNGGTTVQINRNYTSTDTSIITLMEIAA